MKIKEKSREIKNYFTNIVIATIDVGKEDLATIEEDFNLKELFEGTQCEF